MPGMEALTSSLFQDLDQLAYSDRNRSCRLRSVPSHIQKRLLFGMIPDDVSDQIRVIQKAERRLLCLVLKLHLQVPALLYYLKFSIPSFLVTVHGDSLV